MKAYMGQFGETETVTELTIINNQTAIPPSNKSFTDSSFWDSILNNKTINVSKIKEWNDNGKLRYMALDYNNNILFEVFKKTSGSYYDSNGNYVTTDPGLITMDKVYVRDDLTSTKNMLSQPTTPAPIVTSSQTQEKEQKAEPNKKLMIGAVAGLAALWYFNKED